MNIFNSRIAYEQHMQKSQIVFWLASFACVVFLIVFIFPQLSHVDEGYVTKVGDLTHYNGTESHASFILYPNGFVTQEMVLVRDSNGIHHYFEAAFAGKELK